MKHYYIPTWYFLLFNVYTPKCAGEVTAKCSQSKSVSHRRVSSGIRFLAKRIKYTQTANRHVDEPRFRDSYWINIHEIRALFTYLKQFAKPLTTGHTNTAATRALKLIRFEMIVKGTFSTTEVLVRIPTKLMFHNR